VWLFFFVPIANLWEPLRWRSRASPAVAPPHVVGLGTASRATRLQLRSRLRRASAAHRGCGIAQSVAGRLHCGSGPGSHSQRDRTVRSERRRGPRSERRRDHNIVLDARGHLAVTFLHSLHNE
jgi:hypothetical protein